MAEKSQICSNVDMSTDLICRVFPPQKKLSRSADRQAADLVYQDTLISCRLSPVAVEFPREYILQYLHYFLWYKYFLLSRVPT
jgi:hypothetical protein